MPNQPPAAEYLAQQPTISRHKDMVYISIETAEGTRHSCMRLPDYRAYVRYALSHIMAWDEEDRTRVVELSEVR